MKEKIEKFQSEAETKNAVEAEKLRRNFGNTARG